MTESRREAVTSMHVELHHDDDGEWAGLYVNGKLDTYGDSYLADERIRQLFGVVEVQDSPWLLGGSGRNPPPAQTVAEIDAYRTERDANRERARQLREEADNLRHEAELLERKSRD